MGETRRKPGANRGYGVVSSLSRSRAANEMITSPTPADRTQVQRDTQLHIVGHSALEPLFGRQVAGLRTSCCADQEGARRVCDRRLGQRLTRLQRMRNIVSGVLATSVALGAFVFAPAVGDACGWALGIALVAARQKVGRVIAGAP